MNAIRTAAQNIGQTIARRAPKVPPSLQGLLLTAITMGLLLASGPQSYNGYVIQLICVYAVAALGLNITTGFAGALSLGQGAAFALGAYVTAVLAGTYEWPFWLALLLGAVSGLVAGAATGFPAGRLGVIGLAMISLGLVLVVNDMLIQFRGVTGGMFGISGIDARLWFKGEPVGSLWVVPAAIAVVTGLCFWLHSRYRLSRLGQATVAVRDEPIGASALGVSGYLTKVAAFAAGSAFAALGGGLFAYLSAYISPDAFSPNLSILFLVMVVLGGSGSRLGPLAGALILVLVPLQLDEYPHVNTIVYGLLLIVLMRLRPRGLFSRSAAPAPKALQAITDAPPAPEQTPRKPGEPVLEVHDVKRSFGGVYALNGVSLTVHSGEIVGLIGPNGSGKTTLLNVVTGHYPPTSGSITLHNEELGRQSPEAIARRGIARTFQTPKTFPGMSIEEHLALATRHDADPELLSACRQAVRTLLELGGLDPHDRAAMTRESRAMSHGQLRFLEAATAISGCPRVLLLDEPAAGLSASEIEGFERVVADVAAAGVAVVVVEHHLDMIGRLVDRVVVLDLGTVLWEGPPAELHDVDSVRAAYMGVR